jgi:hypothetical protein
MYVCMVYQTSPVHSTVTISDHQYKDRSLKLHSKPGGKKKRGGVSPSIRHCRKTSNRYSSLIFVSFIFEIGRSIA